MHRDERAERVAVGVLVGDEHEALAVAQLVEHALARLRSARPLIASPFSSRVDDPLEAHRALGGVVVDELAARACA